MNTVTDFLAYFHTDWAAMTAQDWLGLLLTVFVFILLFGVYWWVLSPKNKEKIESHRMMVVDEEKMNAEIESNGRSK